jgi:hypothetical protein
MKNEPLQQAMNSAVISALPKASGIALFLDGNIGSELIAGIGTGPDTVFSAPRHEGTRVDVDASHDLSLVLKRTLGLLSACRESVPSIGPVAGVFHNRDEGYIIFLPAPRKPDGE